jgi:uncharacterized repeat protein (TIGR04138 family)
MSLRDELGRVACRDSRYSIQAYLFLLEALEYATVVNKRSRKRRRLGGDKSKSSRHVSSHMLCEAVGELARRQFGLLATTVLSQWGINSTSDIGEVVYHLIDPGDLEGSPADARSDFDNLFDFETEFRLNFDWSLDDVA